MKRFIAFITVIGIVISASTGSFAVSNAKLPKKKQTQLGLYMTAPETMKHMHKHAKKTLFVDVRSRAEVNFLGTATIIDAVIPYMELSYSYEWNKKKGGYEMEVNSGFSNEVARRLKEKGLGKHDTIVLMCRSGKRSTKAANVLASLGYTRVYSVIDGYEGDKAKQGPMKGQRIVNGWKNNRLPWTYKLDKKKMFEG
ncbi:MAG: rhodanese-like domain-containing protein [Gammaproteobacteria bacterium]|nr:rhodanese-like domain-containing protein [Gammaproteobacteria bacterium]